MRFVILDLSFIKSCYTAEIVETTLVISRFRFLRVGSRISELRVIILPGIIVGYQPKKIRQRRYEQKLNENDQYETQSRGNESLFHYLCYTVDSIYILSRQNVAQDSSDL